MEKIGFSGLIVMIVGIMLYSFNLLNIYYYLGLGDFSGFFGEIGYHIFIVGIIFMIIHFGLNFLKLYKINKKNSDKNCSKCGRIIPIDECICPYCWKDFEEKYKK